MTPEEGYAMFRGKCRQMSEDAAKADPSLTVVRGHYWCPMWNRTEAHWWCVDKDGKIVDPTAQQFPSAGMGDYIPFDDIFCCEQCGKTIPEDDAIQMGNYIVCSTGCACRLVGI